jgi:hypothetical protein
MVGRIDQLIWQIPLIILTCIAGSLAGVWVLSRAIGFTMDPSLVAVLSAVGSSVVIADGLRRKRQNPESPAS